MNIIIIDNGIAGTNAARFIRNYSNYDITMIPGEFEFPLIFTLMIKRFSTALLFFAAFAVMMAHSVIPHHHHHEDETTTNHHDNDHDDDDDNDLSNLFSHFQHIELNNQFVFTHKPTIIKQTDIPQSDIAFTNSVYFFDAGTPVPIFFPDPPDIYSSSGSFAFPLRGPPSITI